MWVNLHSPWWTVADGKDPAADDGLLGPREGADELGLDGMADGDVPFDGESCQRESCKRIKKSEFQIEMKVYKFPSSSRRLRSW